MNIFKMYKTELNHKEILQIDGAFSALHVNYNESPVFNGIDAKNIAIDSRKNSISSQNVIEDVLGNMKSFNGTEINYSRDDRILLWKSYWLEYINVFDKLIASMPKSIVTIYVGRQAIELGFKYLLLKKTEKIEKTHDLGKLSSLLYAEYSIEESYMKDIDSFCGLFCKYVEGDNVEYFRFPEYKKNAFFAGNCLDLEWISYNFALIILKLLHFANLDDEV